MKKVNFKLIVVVLLMAVFSSCGLFRRKNRCHTCPSWSSIEKYDDKINS